MSFDVVADCEPRPPSGQSDHSSLVSTDAPRGWTLRILGWAALAASLIIIVVWLGFYFQDEEDGPQLTHTVTRGSLVVTALEAGLLESAENNPIKCGVRGKNTVLWVIESGSIVKPGDVLVRLDSLLIEEQIDERTKFAHWSRSAAERSAANVGRAELAVGEYEVGRFVAERMRIEKDLIVARANLKSAKNILRHAKLMSRSEYINSLEVEEKEFAVQQAELEVEVKETELKVLTTYTKEEQLQTLSGSLAAIKAKHEANAERAIADASRRDRAVSELEHCVVRAKRGGMVIHPNAAKWESRPIAEGSTVHKDQVLLMMPDLDQMQVKIGVHESVIDRIKVGLKATIQLPEKRLTGEVVKIASVTRPAGWWTGNEVRYDTFVSLPKGEGARPGMSAEVEVTIAEYEDVLTIPVAAIVRRGKDRFFCWVRTQDGGAERREIKLGDSNNVHTIVTNGLREGEQVLLNPDALETSETQGEEIGDESGEENGESVPIQDEVAKP